MRTRRTKTLKWITFGIIYIPALVYNYYAAQACKKATQKCTQAGRMESENLANISSFDSKVACFLYIERYPW